MNPQAMIKRETIKRAIDTISMRDPDIGYTLDEMLGMGLIDAPKTSNERDEFYFLFESQKVAVNKYLYLTEGTVPVEQSLLIKYGELQKKQEILDQRRSINFRETAMEIRRAGLEFMVTHEIDYALTRLRRRLKRLEGNLGSPMDDSRSMARAKGTSPKTEGNVGFYLELISFLEEIKRESRSLDIIENGTDPDVLYRGFVDVSTPAYFMRFPYCMDILMQVAAIDVEYFHVRFLLNCLLQELGENLFACVVDQKIMGLIYLTLKEQPFYKGLEIKFMATLRGKTDGQIEPKLASLKGVGTFLLAGVWLLWKNERGDVREIFLDSEIAARHFYESAGFQARGLSAYVLRHPRGYLLKDILAMANSGDGLRPHAIREIASVIRKEVTLLRKKPKGDREESARRLAIESLKECLKERARPEFFRAAVMNLIKYRKKIPESGELIQFALRHASGEIRAYIEHAANTCH